MIVVRNQSEGGNSIIEFALVASFLVPLFAASFTIGMSLVKGIQVGNVCRESNVLFVRSVTDPKSNLDLSLPANQAILMRASQGLHMDKSSPSPYTPDSNGNGVIYLTKIVHVKDLTCAAGGDTGPFDSSNCPNYDKYVFAGSIVIGNVSKGTSQMGTPPSAVPLTNGKYSASDIANTTSLQAKTFTSNFVSQTPQPGQINLPDDGFVLISEMFVDISYLNLFSKFQTPVIYARNFS